MKGKRTTAWMLGGMVGVVALVTVAWQQSDFGRAAGDLAHQRAAAHREGVPIEYEDVRRLAPPLAQEANGADSYLRGFAMLHEAGNLKGVSVNRLIEGMIRGDAKPEDVAKARDGIAAETAALAEIARGTEKGGVWFNRKWEQGSALEFREPGDARSAANSLILRAMMASGPASAAKDLGTAAKISRDFGSEPILICTLVGAAIETNVHQAIRSLGRRGGAWASAMMPVLDEFGPLPDLHRTFAGEAMMGNHLTDELAKSGPRAFLAQGSGEAQIPMELRLSGLKPVRDAFQARIIEYWRKVYAALPKDPLDLAATRAATSMPVPKGGSQALLDMALPYLAGMGNLAAQVETQRRLSRVVLEVCQGKPLKLLDDPYGKGPLKMRANGKEWTIWSVGPDGIDDGGLVKKKEMDTRFDIVVNSRGK